MCNQPWTTTNEADHNKQLIKTQFYIDRWTDLKKKYNLINYREFWEARDEWYPTWKNGTSNDNALQVDYIRIYAATVTNERNRNNFDSLIKQ